MEPERDGADGETEEPDRKGIDMLRLGTGGEVDRVGHRKSPRSRLHRDRPIVV